jgi:hypothetical protein
MTRRLPPLLLAGALACRAPAGPPTPPAAAAPAAPRPCASAQLAAAVTGGDAGMSHRAMTISARNASGAACTLTGYPTLRFLDSTRAPIAALAQRAGASDYFAPESATTTLTLPPGDSAWFEIAYLGAPVGPPCHRVAILGIAPPGDTGAVPLQLGDLVCEDSVDVSPFRRAPPPT